ncbi:hypothetical protein JVT61DRAFT_3268 [Boletus reticuloceps]|uniref:Uncharacterized protein n=1 Tax=Boletus reticuloceps TaxID=495285 RepID=A0A8I2YN36_9AGAM|nr:hypothetical protein JVT61DRAFT_3268 [Boletus reticuloceps]
MMRIVSSMPGALSMDTLRTIPEQTDPLSLAEEGSSNVRNEETIPCQLPRPVVLSPDDMDTTCHQVPVPAVVAQNEGINCRFGVATSGQQLADDATSEGGTTALVTGMLAASNKRSSDDDAVEGGATAVAGGLTTANECLTSGNTIEGETPAVAAGKCRFREVDFSQSLCSELHERDNLVQQLHLELQKQGQMLRMEGERTAEQYRLLYEQGLATAQEKYESQVSDTRSLLALRENEMQLLREAMEAQKAQVQHEHELANQAYASKWTRMHNQFEKQIQAQRNDLEQFSHTNLANALQERDRDIEMKTIEMERRLQDEVGKLSQAIMAEKERELASMEQRYARRGVRFATPTSTPASAPGADNTSGLDDGSSIPAPSNETTRFMSPSPRSGTQMPTVTPSLDAIKRIKRIRGVLRRTRLMGVYLEDGPSETGATSTAAPDCSAQMPPNRPTPLDHPTTAPPDRPIPAVLNEHELPQNLTLITNAIETALRNVFVGSGPKQMSPLKQSPRRKKIEDEEVNLERASEPSIHRDFILNEVRRLFKDEFGIMQDVDFVAHQPASLDDVQAYEHEDGPGPDPEQLAFDLSQGYNSPWNSSILESLLREFQARCKDESWPVKKSDNYVRQALRNRYKRLRTTWLRGQPRLTSNGIVETPAEVEERMLEHLKQLGKASRQNTRRRNVSFRLTVTKQIHRYFQKYLRRVSTLDGVVKLKTEGGDNDLVVWEWLQRLVRFLGENGMSSEESAVENNFEHVLRVKNMEWRRCIDRELDIVDVERIVDSDIFSPQGAKPVKRIRALDNPMSSRDAVKGLPVDLYDGAWFSRLTQREIDTLAVATHRFPWMKVATL